MSKVIMVLWGWLWVTTGTVAGDAGVVLYDRPGFEGRSLTLYEDVVNMKHTSFGNDCAASIHIPRGYKVILFEHRDFGGHYIELRRSKVDLSRTSLGAKALSSIQIIWLGEDWPELPGDTTRGVTLFSETGFQGDYEIFVDSSTRLDRSYLGDDRAASVLVPPGYGVILYEQKHFKGRSVTLYRSESDLGRTPLGRFRVSSLRVFPELRPYEPPVAQKEPMEYEDDWGPHISLGVHIDDDDVGDVLAVAAGALLVTAAVKAIRKNRIPGPGVTLFDGAQFQGRNQKIRRNIRKMKKTSLGNDSASSIRVPPGYEVILYEHEGYRGKSIVLRESVSHLGNTSLGDNRMSSLRIRWVGI